MAQQGRASKGLINPNIEVDRSKNPVRVGKNGEVVAVTSAKQDVSMLPKVYLCTCCGARYPTPDKRFFLIPQSTLFEGNDRYSHVCIECCTRLYNQYTAMYKSQKFGLLLMCAILGVYFNERTYESMVQKCDNGELPLGKYIRTMHGVQYKGKTFLTYLVEMNGKNEVFATPGELREMMESRWSTSDHRNKNYIIQTLGYDPFDDANYSLEDRRFLFNAMAGYMNDDVLGDSHKVQAVINMMKTYLQVAQVDILINHQIKSAQPDTNEIKRMTGIKTDLQSSINAIAKENAISAIGSGKKQKSTNALTAIMKEMLDNGIDAAKANITSARLSEAYQEIATINARSLVAELQFTGDEYAKMVADQSEIIRTQANDITKLEEENRLMKKQLDRIRKSGYKMPKDNIVGEDPDKEGENDADNSSGE